MVEGASRVLKGGGHGSDERHPGFCWGGGPLSHVTIRLAFPERLLEAVALRVRVDVAVRLSVGALVRVWLGFWGFHSQISKDEQPLSAMIADPTPFESEAPP